MKFSQSDSISRHRVSRYDDSSITINHTVYEKSLVVTATHILSPWAINHFADLSLTDLRPIVDLNMDIWILGTGRDTCFPSHKIQHFTADNNIGLEAMTTQAACRTFNLLLAEGRNVAALLILD